MAEKYYHDRHGEPLPPSGGIAKLLYDGPSASGHFCVAMRGYPDLGEVDETARPTKADPARCVLYLRRNFDELVAAWTEQKREPKEAWVVRTAAKLALLKK